MLSNKKEVFSEKLYRIHELYKNLFDDESRLIFKGRICSSFMQDETKLFDEIKTIKKKYQIPELEEYLRNNSLNMDKIIVYGSGFDLEYTSWLLAECGIQTQFWVDNKECDDTNTGKIPLISHQELIINYQDYVVIIASKNNAFKIYENLLYCKFPRNKILCPRRGVLEGICGNQYFDFLKHIPGKQEVFVDCGAFDGNTSFSFVDWCHGEYDKIFMFEADTNNIKLCKKNINARKLKNYRLFECGVWSKKTDLKFCDGNFTSSCISRNGHALTKVYDLDNLLANERVSFIKMDIEGAELEAIKGAMKLIAHNKPRMAISVYHKPEDIIEIPLLLLEISPDYKFCLRHYRSSKRETVLYAF